MPSPWWLLTLAILLEVAGTTCMKLANGFQVLLPSVLVFVLYAASFAALVLCLKSLPLSVAYAIWAGVGTALTFAIGVAIFGEALSLLKIGSVVLIVAGVVGLHLAGSAH